MIVNSNYLSGIINTGLCIIHPIMNAWWTEALLFDFITHLYINAGKWHVRFWKEMQKCLCKDDAYRRRRNIYLEGHNDIKASNITMPAYLWLAHVLNRGRSALAFPLRLSTGNRGHARRISGEENKDVAFVSRITQWTADASSAGKIWKSCCICSGVLRYPNLRTSILASAWVQNNSARKLWKGCVYRVLECRRSRHWSSNPKS